METELLTNIQFVAHLAMAVFLGAVVGAERQWRQRKAGLRTYALVSAGAALFVMLSQSIPNDGDETKIPSYIISGIGFLGAGVIMKDGASVRGLNTAATIWCSAAIGAFSGYGFVFKACVATLGILFANIFLRPLAQKINRVPNSETEEELEYQIKLTCREEDEPHIRYLALQAMTAAPLTLKALESQDLTDAKKVEVTAHLNCLGSHHVLLEQIVSRLSLERGVTMASWTIV